jgi:hypothetical protein
MFLELNITDEDRLLLSDDAVITSINICNTGASDLLLGLYKQTSTDGDKFYFLKDVTLKKTHTFLAEDMIISGGDKFYISVAGTCSVIVDYK